MGIDALTHDDAGNDVSPQDDAGWQQWVGATDTRSAMLEDPLLDWLGAWGSAAGFTPDNALESYDPRTDFVAFLRGAAQQFEQQVMAHLDSIHPVARVSNKLEFAVARDLAVAQATFAAMQRGEAIIAKPVLWDAQHRTYGVPDLLVRSDVLRAHFPSALDSNEAQTPAPTLSGPWHYCVVDIKFKTLSLLAGGGLGNDDTLPADKAQVFIYNRALGRLQGYQPPHGFVLGRGWKQTVKKATLRGQTCLERLGPVPAADARLAGAVDAAVAWLRRVRQEGRGWRVLPQPSVTELWPNMNNDKSDYPWHDAKKQIAAALGEVTLVTNVSLKHRRQAHEQGIFSWQDPRCTVDALGVTGASTAPRVQAVLDANRGGPPVQPARIAAARDQWHAAPPLEFFVDFEHVTDSADNGAAFPAAQGYPLVFMIGCGHIEDGCWTFSPFIADALTPQAEGALVDEWLEHMLAVQRRLAPLGDTPRLIHWSNAETTQYRRAQLAHPDRRWPDLPWFDIYKEVVLAEPVTVRGALGFGLKAVAKAMHAHGLIETQWSEGPADGLGAMAGAWWCAAEAGAKGATLPQQPLMQEIAQYNQVDCKAMMEIVRYLRANH